MNLPDTNLQPHGRPTRGDLFFETFVSGATGGAVIAFFFLIVDTVLGRALWTPSFAGQVLFNRANPSEVGSISMLAIANMTMLHILGFVVVGFVSSLLVRWVGRTTENGFLLAALGVFALLEVPALLVSGLMWPELGVGVGHARILVANLIAAPAMTAVLRFAHESATHAPEPSVAHELSATV